ncbi:MAG: hypothetical protein JXB10_02090 [Pirellulales bacterium]|nr:hypothetical protein [Pirellulales bacterium]
MTLRRFRTLVLGVALGWICSASAAELEWKVDDGRGALGVAGKYYDVELSLHQPQFLRLAADSLGEGRFPAGALRSPPAAERPTVATRSGNRVEYRRKDSASPAPARWTFEFGEKTIRMVSQWTADDPPEPVVLDFDSKCCHATLLGLVRPDRTMPLPAILHLPDQGSFRITAAGPAPLDYDARRAVGPFVKITFPPAAKETPRVEYLWEATAIYPKLSGIENDPRFNGFRRNWLNIFQVNPRLGAIANHSASDVCASCASEYADIALHTPPLTNSLSALDLIRQLLDRYLAGKPGYGFPGWSAFDFPSWPPSRNPIFLDAYPNLLIAAADYVIGSGDRAWLKTNYQAVRGWAEALLAMDRDGNGLFEYELSGNSGSWPAALHYRPSNWWDTIGFGHEDAYSNALAYRALRGMEKLAAQLNETDDAARYRAAADRLRGAYAKTFYNPATGVLAGWKSADGKLHDYYFLFVNGIAIHYGLIPKDQANAIMDKLLAKMKEVGYTRFDLGLPGNLIPVARKDYVDLNPRFGGGKKEDNSDGFQIYENGGATACFAYFTLAALYDLGRRDEADRILFPMLKSFEEGSFQGFAPNGMTNDWKAWDGTPWGYEGFLTDNYYALLAVLARQHSLNNAIFDFGPEKETARPSR